MAPRAAVRRSRRLRAAETAVCRSQEALRTPGTAGQDTDPRGGGSFPSGEGHAPRLPLPHPHKWEKRLPPGP